MKKLNLLCVVVVLSAASVGAFEVPSVPKMTLPVSCLTASASFNKAATKQQVQGIEDSVDAINVALDQSVNALASVLVNKEELIKLKANRDELLKKASTKEKDAIIQQFEESVEAQLKATTQNANISAQLKGLSSAQKALVGDCIGNLSLAALGYTDIAAQAMNVAQTIQNNPSAIVFMGPELKTLGKLATTLPGQAKSVGGLSVNLVKIATAGGITIPKATKGAKLKPVANSDF